MPLDRASLSPPIHARRRAPKRAAIGRPLSLPPCRRSEPRGGGLRWQSTRVTALALTPAEQRAVLLCWPHALAASGFRCVAIRGAPGFAHPPCKGRRMLKGRRPFGTGRRRFAQTCARGAPGAPGALGWGSCGRRGGAEDLLSIQ